VPKLSIQVLGGGGSRRVAEQAAAKLALEQAQALMPASVRKPRRTVRAAAAAAAEARELADSAEIASGCEPVIASVTVAASSSRQWPTGEPLATDALQADPPMPEQGAPMPAPLESRRRVQAA
jgi:hypothetical protein